MLAVMERHTLSDAQWERLRPLLPPPPQGRGRPRTDDRLIVDGMRYRLATGGPWRDPPARFGPSRAAVRVVVWRVRGGAGVGGAGGGGGGGGGGGRLPPRRPRPAVTCTGRC